VVSRAQDEPVPPGYGGDEEHEVRFAQGLSLADAAEVALEDYARELLKASRAEALRDARTLAVQGVRVIGATIPPALEVRRDIEDFARGLAQSGAGPGLGWS
jgi:hypothetical protein